MNRREWWIESDPAHADMPDAFPVGTTKIDASKRHLVSRAVEIKDDEIVVSKDQLREAFARAYCVDPNTRKVVDTNLWLAMERELYGE